MDLFKNIVQGQRPMQPGSNQPSLLADWNSYAQHSAVDIEAGTSTSTGISKTVGDIGGNISSKIRSGYTVVSDGISNVQAPNFENT